MQVEELEEVGRHIQRERARAGLNQRNLAEHAGLSQPTLHRIEQGARAALSVTELDRIARALDVPVRYLLQGNPVADRVRVAPRTAREATQEDLDEARRMVVDLLALDDRLTESAAPHRTPTPQRDSGRSAPVTDAEGQGRTAAAALRTRLGLGIAPLVDLPELLETATHLDAGAVSIPSTVSGISAQDPARGVAVALVNICDVPERQRFSYAHELGHVVLDDGVAVDHLRGGRSPQEIRCDAFARHFLAPLEGVRQEWQRTATTCAPTADDGSVDPLRRLAQVARHYRVSLSVARIQCARLGIGLSPECQNALPTNREAAWRFGWGPEYEAEVKAAQQISPPRRILERAVQAYAAGSIGLKPLARLLCMDVQDAEAQLEGAGIRPPAAPQVRRIDARSMAAARRRLQNRDDEEPPQA
ncbi:helix-turn-helix domain-containing protein [Streptomyces sp. NPDC056683]|uniref:helix-turn-helix domain-containing protein n=1 Tax=Streptomyces sp. NPDC056683 TaxID=3345910 RepID=UPI0036CAFC1E